MESSNDSFLWTDVSDDSDDNSKNKSAKLIEMKYKDEPDSSIHFKQKLYDENLVNENKSKEIKLKTKKRKCSEAIQESSDCSQPERKRIKLEPESDIDNGNKRKIKNDINIQSSTLYDEDYNNFKVKEEETCLVQSKKKKKKKRSNSNIAIFTPQSDSAIDTNIDGYLDMRVKQEQASVIEPEVVKSKKKKKHKSKSTASSDTDIVTEAKSVMTISEVTVQDESTSFEESATLGETTEYSIIQEKFCAEETVVEKSRKGKHKKDAVAHDNLNFNDLSLEPSDFTCNNIVSSTILNTSTINLRDKQLKQTESSTILNTSTINLRDKQLKQTEELIQKSKNVLPSKISDRIRFEEDDNLSQHEHHIGRTSAKLNMFLKLNPQLKLCASETSKHTPITKDDEIWTLSWPHEINLEKLKNTTVTSEGKCKIKIDGQTYEGFLNEDVITVTLLTHEPSHAYIKKIPIKECIEYHKRIPKVHIPDNNIMVNNQRIFTPLPEIKCRHPLFGAQYKKSIKISTAVVEKLQAAKGRYSENLSKKIKKREHKKHKHKSADIKTELDCVYIKPEHEALSKNKKRKCSQENNEQRPKKNKQVTLNADSPAVWESEKAIEENLFNF